MVETERFQIVIETDGIEANKKVINEYIRTCIKLNEKQAEAIDSFHFFTYYFDDDSPLGGEVKFRINGEKDFILGQEEYTLNSKEYINNWYVKDYELETDKYGEQGAVIADKLFEIGSRTALIMHDKFKEIPDPVDTFKGEDGKLPAGTWLFIHTLFNNSGYETVDEIDACAESISNRLRFLYGYDKNMARDELDRLKDFFDEIKEVLYNE